MDPQLINGSAPSMDRRSPFPPFGPIKPNRGARALAYLPRKTRRPTISKQASTKRARGGQRPHAKERRETQEVCHSASTVQAQPTCADTLSNLGCLAQLLSPPERLADSHLFPTEIGIATRASPCPAQFNLARNALSHTLSSPPPSPLYYYYLHTLYYF